MSKQKRIITVCEHLTMHFFDFEDNNHRCSISCDLDIGRQTNCPFKYEIISPKCWAVEYFVNVLYHKTENRRKLVSSA